MSYVAEAAWIRDRLATGWAGRTPVHWDNVAYEPQVGTPYIRPTVRPTTAYQAEIGPTATYRHLGMLIVEVFTPMGSGEAGAQELADEVVALFRGARTQGLSFQAPYVIAADTVDAWYKLDVLCPFTRNTIHTIT
jgi:hypothetical protein